MKKSMVILTFALGAIATFALSKNLESKKVTKDVFDREVTIQDIEGPIEDRSRNHQRMFDQVRKMFDQVAERSFESAFNDSTMMVGGTDDILIKNNSDKNFEYIEISGDDLDPKSLNINIENGMVSISGRVEKVIDNGRSGFKSSSTYISSFQRSFSVPQGVDESKVTFEPQKNKLIIKFKKV